MKRIISFAIFDSSKHAYRPGFYWQHLKHTVWGYLSLFPDWELRIFHDKSLYDNYYGGVLLRLQDKGFLKLIYMGEETAICRAMLWRLEPLFDPEVEYVLCRDTDHNPTIREKKMVEQFIQTKKALHCVQDNLAHVCPMLGGLIGFNVESFRKTFAAASVDNLLRSFHWNKDRLTEHGDDQNFMNKHLWPKLRSSSALHSIRGNDAGASILLPNVEASETIDTCTPFMGTARCDFDKWYQELKKHGDAEKIKEIEKAERDVFVGRNFSHVNLELACTNKKRVVLATDHNVAYYFFMPIVSTLWQKYIGYCPIIVIVGTIKEWLDDPQKMLALEETRKTGAEIHFIPTIDGYKSASVAQNSRLYVSCLPMYSDTMYLVLSDMDMIPLNRTWFNKQNTQKRIHLDYSHVYDHMQYPLCYIGCSVATWREIMKPSHPNDITESVRSQFVFDKLIEEKDGMKIWCYDEKMFGEKIKAWSGYPNECQMFDRHGCPPVDRIDRSCWPKTFDVTKMVDCHSVRPGYTSPNWEKIESVLQQILSGEDLKQVLDYRWNFCLKGQ